MDENPHTLRNFEDALNRLRNNVLRMGSLVVANFENAVRGLLQRDKERCNEAIVEDETIDNFDRRIDEEGMEILLKFQPVARDLRLVIGSMKISSNLERISDLSANIARRSIKVLRRSEVKETLFIEPVFHMALEQVQGSLKAFSDGDVEMAMGMEDKDGKLDEAHNQVIKKLTRVMEEDVDNLRIYLNLVHIIRYIERVGDHAVNISEDAAYMHWAEDIRHAREPER